MKISCPSILPLTRYCWCKYILVHWYMKNQRNAFLSISSTFLSLGLKWLKKLFPVICMYFLTIDQVKMLCRNKKQLLAVFPLHRKCANQNAKYAWWKHALFTKWPVYRKNDFTLAWGGFSDDYLKEYGNTFFVFTAYMALYLCVTWYFM